MASTERLGVAALRATITSFRDGVRDHAARINRLNVYPVPDGDTGTNMFRTLDAVVAELELAPPGDLVAACKAIAHGSLMGARGNSGVILSQLLRGFVGALERAAEGSAADVAVALNAAAKAAYTAVLKPMEGTILTVAREAGDAAARAAAAGAGLVGVLEAARAAGQQALDHTPELLPVLKQAGVVDAGGAGFLLMLDAALHAVDGRPLPVAPAVDDTVAALTVAPGAAGDVADLRYEVMCFLDLADEHIDAFKHAWGDIGDSIVVVGGDGLWNCHVHTNDIGAAIEATLIHAGRPSKIRVTDLFEEVDEQHRQREAALHGHHGPSTAGLPAVTTAVVAVASGQGLAELFGQLGVQGVVTGGQTMNPSTAELLAAVDAVNAHQVLVLPNNKNIIAVAEQLDSLTDKQVRVVRTRSMPEALAALVVYDPEATAAANTVSMEAAIEGTATGEVTQAIRDTETPAGSVQTGDWIGIARGDGVVSVGGSVTTAACALLDVLVTPSHEIVTVIAGAQATQERTDEIRAWLAEQRPGVEVEVHRGGQPLYPYLFGVE